MIDVRDGQRRRESNIIRRDAMATVRSKRQLIKAGQGKS